MTIFKNLILQNIMNFSQVNLLVFDECHHAVKNHDYVQIMRRYKDNYEGHLEHPTRILGLTASLIPSKCKPGDLKKKIEELEKTLQCRSQTAEDLNMVAKYATNPNEHNLFYMSSEEDQDVQALKRILEPPMSFLEGFSKQMKTSEFYEIVKVNLGDCHHILLNLGIWCAHRFALNSLCDINDRIDECRGIYGSDWEKSLIYLCKTHIEMFLKDSECILKKGFHMADKIKTLLLHLGDSAICSGEISCQDGRLDAAGKKGINRLTGIIFTQRRTTAVLLCTLLQNQSRITEDLSHIRSDYVVGHDTAKNYTYLRKEAKMSSKKQEEVLEKFRKGQINLLVSTSVVEEGVDVPKCNMVIRFDFPENFRSYVQSKGRARAKVSKYILLIPHNERVKLCGELRCYNDLVKELEAICHKRHVFDDGFEFLADQVEPYENSSGAKATINSSITVVHR